MINELRPIAIFVEVVRHGSFRGAAKQLNLSPSAVSYNVAQLESRVGNALLYRSTRKLSLTKEGEHLFERASELLSTIAEGLDDVTGNAPSIRGRLVVSVTTALLHSNLNSKITQFCAANPHIDIEIHYTDERQDLIRDGIDVVIRAGDMRDSALKSKLITRIARRLVCASSYYHSQVPAKRPEELNNWRWIKLSMMPEGRQLKKGKRVFKAQGMSSQVSVNSVDAMLQFCVLGMGLATPPSFMVEPLLKQGNLVEVLPEWEIEPIPIYAVWPENQVKNKTTQKFIKHINGV